MKSYRLVVRQQGRIVGHFETSGLDALEDICVARAMFGITGGAAISASCKCPIPNAGYWRVARMG